MVLRCWFRAGRGAGRRPWRRLSAGLLGLVAALLTTTPSRGEIISVGSVGSAGSAGLDGLATDELTDGLGAAEQARLEALLGVQQPEVLSTLSPDGSTLVVALTSRTYPEERRLHFLNIRTGELSEALALEYDLLTPDLPLRWLSNDTVQYVQQDAYGPWEIVSVNRVTEIASRTQIYPTQAEEGEMLGMAPDFSKFALRVYGETEDIVYMVFLPSLRRLEVARLPEALDVQPPAWSANGDQVALVISSGDERRLYDRTPNSPGLANPVVQDALGRLAPADNPFYQHSAVRVYDFAQADPLRLELTAPDHGGDPFAEASLSPDGELLLVKRYRPSSTVGRAYPSYAFPESAYFEVYDRAGTRLETVTAAALRGPVEATGQFLGRDRILFWGTEGLNRHLYTYPLGSGGEGSLTPLPLPPGSVDVASVTASPDGATVIYGFSSVTQPPELFAIAPDGVSLPRPLTSINAAVAASNQVQMHPVSFTTRQGERQGFLVQPAGRAFPPVAQPLVFWQQGGPGFSMANEFATEVEMPLNLLPNFGLGVLVVPLSGREGFGPERYRALADGQNFGQLDVQEGADIVAQAVQQGWTTAAQVGVTGCSYGGYYAAQITAQFPRLFAAANPQCSLLDAFTEWQLGYSSLLSYLVGQTPMEAPDTYRQISPLYNAAAIRTPTLLFHGAEDFLQVDVARNFHDVMDLGAGEVTLYVFEGVGHSLYGSGYQALAAELQIEFFRQHLQP
ncbi:MAG TPA: prolyl oligopeptidase family serine peptidase [Nodosilinea sp.]|nr:prolyl oligopeptidase family serine peptidase [Nodosilinea sp.]